MSRFLDREKPRQAKFKRSSASFSAAALEDGLYKNHPYPYCLPRELAEENLFPEIRRTALAFFAAHAIKWHDGHGGQPSNHLCSSQVCCVNFLFPFAHRPEALAAVLRPFFPELKQMLTIEDKQYVTFEWIGQENYLKEKIAPNRERPRGALFTSADAAVKFERHDGTCQVVLIEWKYTEAYYSTPLRWSKARTDRTKIYRHLYDSPDCPLNKDRLESSEVLFYEPFYQFMRQQYLARCMERAHELQAEAVSVLHIAPDHNLDFRRVTSPALTALGDTATSVWAKLVRTEGKFLSVSTERLFGQLSVEQLPDMRDWQDYIGARYPWVQADTIK